MSLKWLICIHIIIFCFINLISFHISLIYHVFFQCHVSVVPVYSCLQKRTLKEFSKTLTVALTICIGSYSLPAIFGYLTFGSDVQSDILTSYDPDPEVLVAVVMIAAKIYTTYPILLFVGR